MLQKRAKTPTVIQMEAVECGAASLGIILGYYGKHVSLEELRIACGVSRDGSNAWNIMQAAKGYGLEVQAYRKGIEELKEIPTPAILFWEFNHFLVLEGFRNGRVYLNDPSIGPRVVTEEEFLEGFAGIVITLQPTEQFEKGGKMPPLIGAIWARLKSVKSALLYIFLTTLCLVIPGLALPAFTRIFVDNILVADILPWRIQFIITMGMTIVLTGVLIWLRQHFLIRLNAKLSFGFSGRFLWHLFSLPIPFFMQRNTGDITHRMIYNNQVANTMTGTLATATVDLFIVIFYAAFMFQYDVAIALVALIAGLATLAVMVVIQKMRTDTYARIKQESSKIYGNLIGTIQHIETIKASGIEQDAFTKFAGYYTKAMNSKQNIGKQDVILATCPVLLQGFATAILLSFGGWRVIYTDLTIGMLIALQTLMLSFFIPLFRFVNFGELMQELKIDLARLDDVLKNPVDRLFENGRMEEKSLELPLKLDGYLEFKNVQFGYSRLAPPFISDLSFKLTPGKWVALVGPSGCGKSTVAKLASGLFQSWEGEILYDGKPLHHIPKARLNRTISSVDQEIFLFAGSIRENLTLWDGTIPEDTIVNAAIDACIHDEIILHKDAYQSQLIEGGRNWSGGQRQRFEIARALIVNPTLLFLDEATSALDSEVEKKIIDNLRKRGCACLVIAHRLSTIKECDEIIVLDAGKVVQRGTHDELKNVEGVYRDLIESEGL